MLSLANFGVIYPKSIIGCCIDHILQILHTCALYCDSLHKLVLAKLAPEFYHFMLKYATFMSVAMIPDAVGTTPEFKGFLSSVKISQFLFKLSSVRIYKYPKINWYRQSDYFLLKFH